jgi:hypothetical protein
MQLWGADVASDPAGSRRGRLGRTRPVRSLAPKYVSLQAPHHGTRPLRARLAALIVPGVYGRGLSLRLSDSPCQTR